MERLKGRSPYHNPDLRVNDRVFVSWEQSRYSGLVGVVRTLTGDGCVLLEVPRGSIRPSDHFKGKLPSGVCGPNGDLLLIAVGWIEKVGSPKSS